MQLPWKQAVTKCPGGMLLPPSDLIRPRPVPVMQTLSLEARTAEDGKPQRLRRQWDRDDLPKLSLKEISEGRRGWRIPQARLRGLWPLWEQAGWELGCLTFTLCTLGPTHLQAKSQFKRRSTANNVEIHIPVPNDADSPKFKTTVGSVKWVPENSEIVWSIKSFPVSTFSAGRPQTPTHTRLLAGSCAAW